MALSRGRFGFDGQVYRVTHDGCSCPDRQKLGVACKREICIRQLCAEFRALKAASEPADSQDDLFNPSDLYNLESRLIQFTVPGDDCPDVSYAAYQLGRWWANGRWRGYLL